jgi:LuxR family maltose regulon positive regulatory protein
VALTDRVVSTVTEVFENAQGPHVPVATAVPGADPLGDPFLRTRFALPARPVTFLRRRRLVDHLDQALGTPLTLLNGAAGAGKTLLAVDWAAGLRPPVAWLTVDEGNRRPGVFWAYVLQALRSCGAPASDAVGAPTDASAVDRKLLVALAAELHDRDRPVVLVIDEYDRVTDPEIAELVPDGRRPQAHPRRVRPPGPGRAHAEDSTQRRPPSCRDGGEK